MDGNKDYDEDLIAIFKNFADFDPDDENREGNGGDDSGYDEKNYEYEEESEDEKMSAFDRVIGYDTIKEELLQICDMIKNKEYYERLGAQLPQGLLLYGDPGLGKTLMAHSFIKESGLQAYTVRRNKGNEDFIGEITKTFRKAAKNAPSIVFLDDMDKFANEDNDHRDAEEYVAVQAGIDEVKGKSVFVLATVNEMYKLPRSLVRSGRFDRKIEVVCPTNEDAEKIIRYYLGSKKVSDDIDMEDLARMISYSSCAELEMLLNEAAISAAHERKESIEMDDLVRAVLRMQYDSPDNFTKTSEDELKKTSLHEAGHLVVSEVLCPGSVGLASIRARGRGDMGGFIHRCKDLGRRPYYVLVSLAGKAATELYYSDACASGCQEDIQKAYDEIRSGISNSGTRGLGFVDITTHQFQNASQSLLARNEAAVEAELERLMFKVRDILLTNREFLEKTAKALFEKETLLYSDIRALRESVTIVGAVV